MVNVKRGNKEPISNSMQIWYSGQNGAKLELDINVWRLKSFFRKTYIDFGMKISEPNKVEKVYIYFPFNVSKEKIEDLGGKLENQSTLKGIFNENFVPCTSEKNSKIIEVIENKNDTKKTKFSVYKLSDEDFDIESGKFGGTLVSFKVKGEKTGTQVSDQYYRFRIFPKKYGTFVKRYRPQNSFFESAFIETEIVDFRIAEKRNQSENLLEAIAEGKTFEFKAINFFVMSPIHDEIMSDGVNIVYKRQLEEGHFWDDYLEQTYKKASVYKCKSPNEEELIEDFNCFFKIKYRKSNFLTILIYLIVLCVVTILLDAVSECVREFLGSLLGGGEII